MLPPTLVCMQIAGLVKLMKGPALPNGGTGAAVCLPADSRSISLLALPALGCFLCLQPGSIYGQTQLHV